MPQPCDTELPGRKRTAQCNGHARQDLVSIEIAQHPATEGDNVLTNLLLAWCLSVRRGNFGFPDEEHIISWELGDCSNDVESETLTNLVKGRDIEACLNNLRHRGKSLSSATRLVAYAQQVGARIDDSPQLLFRADIQSFSVRLMLQDRNFEISANLLEVYLDCLRDNFNLICKNPLTPIADCMPVCRSELAKIWDWGKDPALPIDRTMHSYISEQAVTSPNAPAVVSWDGKFTYNELEHLSTKLSQQLRSHGVKSNVAVPLCFEKSVWTVIAVVAIMKAGGAFVLTDPSQPEERLHTIVEEVAAKVVLTSVKHTELGYRIAPKSQVISIGPELLSRMEEKSCYPPPHNDPHDLMYIIFTSGSTGKPKGVMITHTNYTSGAIPRASIVGYERDVRVLDFASYAFDVSIDCMLLTLATGGCVCVPSDEDRVNNLSGAIRSMNVNMVHTTPSIARVFDPDVIPSLKVLGLGGEPVPAKEASVWNEQTRVLIAYGPSECTVGCSFTRWEAGKKYTSLGRGCGGMLWIVDPTDHNRLAPIGASGELLVEGPIVGEGYINDLEKTSAAFIENPAWLTVGYNDQPGRKARLYKTGDLVKYDPDGSGAIVFVGRKDQQVKIRGQRVELEEVEHHLRQRLSSQSAVVAEVISPGGTGDPMLVAFVAEHDIKQEELTNMDCRFSSDFGNFLVGIEADLSKEVPKYMIPSSFIAISQIPSMVSGKTDRKRLRAFGASLSRKQLLQWRPRSEHVFKRRPLTETEQKVKKLWSAVLGQEVDPAPHDTFFALGGDSLKAMRLVAVSRKEGLTLTIGTIFAYPTLEAMSAKTTHRSIIASSRATPFSLLSKDFELKAMLPKIAQLCTTEISDVEDAYPCTPLQEGLMALSAKTPESYVAQRVMSLSDKTSLMKLATAMDISARSCSILRTRIVHLPGHGLIQVVLKPSGVWQRTNDLRLHLVRDRDNIMELGKPLCRFALVETESGGFHFVLTIHHALYDGWSMPLVVDRINRAYHDLEQPTRTPFTAFIEHFQQQDRTASERYWEKLLKGTCERQFPSLPYRGYQTCADSLLERHIQAPKLTRSNITLATVIRGAWAMVAAQYLRSPDVVFGETLTGRNADVFGIEEIEAPLIATVPVRVAVQDIKVSDYLTNIQQQTIDRIPHEQLGLQNIRLLSRDARRACDLRTGLVLHPSEDGSSKITEGPASSLVPAGDIEAAQEALKFNSYALMLVCTIEKEGFLAMASFDSNCCTTETMSAVLDTFNEIFKALAASVEGEETLMSHICDLSTPDSTPGHELENRELREDAPGTQEDPRRATSSGTAESLLKNLCSGILHVSMSELSSNTDFFDLGGDSISVMKLVSELRSAGYQTTVAKIFTARRLDLISQSLTKTLPTSEPDKSKASAQTTAMAAGEDLIRDRINSTLSNVDWNLESVYLARPLQAIAVTGTTKVPRYSVRYEKIFINGSLDQTRLLESCQELVKTNEVLRTIFASIDGRCYGAVVDYIQNLIDEYNISGDIKKFADDVCDLDIRTQMPLGRSFVKFFLIRNVENQHCLIFRISHAQYDEMCLPLMLEQLSDLYQRKTTKEPIPFSSFVQHVLNDNIPKSVNYWSELLQGSQISKLPGPPITLTNTTKLISLTRSINIVNRPKSVTLASFPTAAWALTLAHRLSINDIVFGEVASGRNISFPNADRVTGPCWQYIPFRLRIDPSWTNLDLLQNVQNQHITSSQFEGIGLSELVEKCTDWQEKEDVKWFDSVVHQAVTGTQTLSFGEGLEAEIETYYPHIEPLREWKIQAFAGGDEMVLEVVTFEEWRDFGRELLDDLVGAFERLVRSPDQLVELRTA